MGCAHDSVIVSIDFLRSARSSLSTWRRAGSEQRTIDRRVHRRRRRGHRRRRGAATAPSPTTSTCRRRRALREHALLTFRNPSVVVRVAEDGNGVGGR